MLYFKGICELAVKATWTKSDKFEHFRNGWKVVIARRSKAMHSNPTYMLYSDPTSLNKWGFLYVQFRVTAYYYIIPTLIYIAS